MIMILLELLCLQMCNSDVSDIDLAFYWNETHIIKNSKYPYNMNFEWKNNEYTMKDKTKIKDAISVFINKADLEKIDSSDAVWGYLENPHLKDTIKLEYSDYMNIHHGTIKVW